MFRDSVTPARDVNAIVCPVAVRGGNTGLIVCNSVATAVRCATEISARKKGAEHWFCTLWEKGRAGVEPAHDGFAIRCLSHLATAPILFARHRPLSVRVLAKQVDWANWFAPATSGCYSGCIGTTSSVLKSNPLDSNRRSLASLCGRRTTVNADSSSGPRIQTLGFTAVGDHCGAEPFGKTNTFGQMRPQVESPQNGS